MAVFIALSNSFHLFQHLYLYWAVRVNTLVAFDLISTYYFFQTRLRNLKFIFCFIDMVCAFVLNNILDSTGFIKQGLIKKFDNN